MKQAAIIWCVALVVAILGVFYVNWCIDSARSGFVREEAVDASSFPASTGWCIRCGAGQDGAPVVNVCSSKRIAPTDINGFQLTDKRG